MDLTLTTSKMPIANRPSSKMQFQHSQSDRYSTRRIVPTTKTLELPKLGTMATAEMPRSSNTSSTQGTMQEIRMEATRRRVRTIKATPNITIVEEAQEATKEASRLVTLTLSEVESFSIFSHAIALLLATLSYINFTLFHLTLLY